MGFEYDFSLKFSWVVAKHMNRVLKCLATSEDHLILSAQLFYVCLHLKCCTFPDQWFQLNIKGLMLFNQTLYLNGVLETGWELWNSLKFIPNNTLSLFVSYLDLTRGSEQWIRTICKIDVVQLSWFQVYFSFFINLELVLDPCWWCNISLIRSVRFLLTDT